MWDDRPTINHQSEVAYGLSIGIDMVSLNGVVALILLYFTEFDSFAGLLKVDLYCLQNIVFHFWPQQTHPAALTLCDS